MVAGKQLKYIPYTRPPITCTGADSGNSLSSMFSTLSGIMHEEVKRSMLYNYLSVSPDPMILAVSLFLHVSGIFLWKTKG